MKTMCKPNWATTWAAHLSLCTTSWPSEASALTARSRPPVMETREVPKPNQKNKHRKSLAKQKPLDAAEQRIELTCCKSHPLASLSLSRSAKSFTTPLQTIRGPLPGGYKAKSPRDIWLGKAACCENLCISKTFSDEPRTWRLGWFDSQLQHYSTAAAMILDNCFTM